MSHEPTPIGPPPARPDAGPFPTRRSTLRSAGALGLASIAGLVGVRGAAAGAPPAAPAARHPDPRWQSAAAAMRRLAESWGDQPYGAVLVRDGAVVGDGPSRVVLRGDPDAHAEREAIRDAIARHGPEGARGAVLYATSRPCRACERAAARAGVARMFFGDEMRDAGVPVER